MFEPLNQTDAVGIKVLAEIESFQLRSTLDPVKIDVIDRQAALVFVYQSKARAPNPGVFAYFKALRHTPNKTRLASPQLADKSNNLAAFQQFTEPASPSHRLAGRTGQDTPRSHQSMSPTSTTNTFLSRFRGLRRRH